MPIAVTAAIPAVKKSKRLLGGGGKELDVSAESIFIHSVWRGEKELVAQHGQIINRVTVTHPRFFKDQLRPGNGAVGHPELCPDRVVRVVRDDRNEKESATGHHKTERRR